MFDMSFGAETFVLDSDEGETFSALEGEAIRRRMPVTTVVRPVPRALPSQIASLVKLRYLRRYEAGWNGPGSSAALPGSFDLAEKFLGLIASRKPTFDIEVLIHSCGTALLSITSQTVSARLEFVPNGDIAANIDDCDGEHDLDIGGFDGSQLPTELIDFLDPATAAAQCRAA